MTCDLTERKQNEEKIKRQAQEIMEMVTLMGGRTVIAGMKPAVAITATPLGLTLGNSLTALNADRALDMLIKPQLRAEPR